MAMASNASLLLEKAKSVSEPQYLQDMVEFRSAYVPTESERQLEFLDFNEGDHHQYLETYFALLTIF